MKTVRKGNWKELAVFVLSFALFFALFRNWELVKHLLFGP